MEHMEDMKFWLKPKQGIRLIAHAIVRDKRTGLVCKEFRYGPNYIKFVKHEEHIVFGECEPVDCFAFYFPSGRSCFFSHKDFSYEIDNGVIEWLVINAVQEKRFIGNHLEKTAEKYKSVKNANGMGVVLQEQYLICQETLFLEL